MPVPLLSRPPQPSLPNWANQLVNKPYLVEEVNEQLKAKVREDTTMCHVRCETASTRAPSCGMQRCADPASHACCTREWSMLPAGPLRRSCTTRQGLSTATVGDLVRRVRPELLQRPPVSMPFTAPPLPALQVRAKHLKATFPLVALVFCSRPRGAARATLQARGRQGPAGVRPAERCRS